MSLNSSLVVKRKVVGLYLTKRLLTSPSGVGGFILHYCKGVVVVFV